MSSGQLSAKNGTSQVVTLACPQKRAGSVPVMYGRSLTPTRKQTTLLLKYTYTIGNTVSRNPTCRLAGPGVDSFGLLWCIANQIIAQTIAISFAKVLNILM
jgi:hypothetical protein